MSKTIGITLKVNGVEQSIKSVEELEETIKGLNDEIKKEDIGSERFKKLTGELQNAKSELKTFEKQFEGLEPQQKAESFVKLGEGIAGAFAVGAGALGLFGAESERLAEIQTKVQSAIAISIGVRQLAEARLQGAIAARIVQEKAYQAVQTLTTFVVGGTTGALKAFRIALAATGIGLIIIALGALVANFDKVKAALGFTNSELDKTKKKLAEVGAEAKSGTITMSRYRDIVLDTTRSEEERQTALERLKELGIDTNDINLQNEDSLRLLNERVEDSINLAIAKARVDAVLNLIKEKTTEQIKLENSELSENVSWYEYLWNGLRSQGNPALLEMYNIRTAINNQTEDSNKLQEEQNDLMEILNKEMENLFQFETKVYTQKRKTNQQTKDSNKLKELEKKRIDELIQSYNRYSFAIGVLSEVQVPQVEALEELNEKLARQKTLMTDLISPIDSFRSAVEKSEDPLDKFGAFFAGITEWSPGLPEELKGFRRELEELFYTFEGTDPQAFSEALNNLFVESTQGKNFPEEALDALQKIINSGYVEAFKALSGDPELRKSISDAYEYLWDNPYSYEAREKFEQSLEDAFKKLNPDLIEKSGENIGKLTEEGRRGFDAWSDSIQGLLEGTSDLEDEIEAVFKESNKLVKKYNGNLEDSQKRLKILDGAYTEFYDSINAYDAEYTEQYEQSLRDQNAAALQKMMKEIEYSDLSFEEREKLLRKYEKLYLKTEENIDKKIKESAKKRFEEQTEGLLTFLDGAAKAAQDIANLVNDITNIQLQALDQMFDKRFQKLDDEYQLDLTKAGDNVRAKNRIEEKYQKERLKLEEEYEAERRRLQKKALIADLIAKTLSIISQTAVNIVKVFPNPFLMAAAGVLGIAQGAVAVAQYNAARKLRRGGILDGPLHAQGGIMMGDGSEAEGGEIVLTRGVASNRQALMLANQANILGGGDNLIRQTGAFDSQTLIESIRGAVSAPIIKTYVVADEVQRENVISKKIADRSKL